MSNRPYDEEAFIQSLVTAGVIAVTIYGTYRVIKAIGSYKSGEIVSQSNVAELKREIPIRYESNTFSCEKHGTIKICPDCGKDCVICSPGDYTSWKCEDCSNNDWYFDD